MVPGDWPMSYESEFRKGRDGCQLNGQTYAEQQGINQRLRLDAKQREAQQRSCESASSGVIPVVGGTSYPQGDRPIVYTPPPSRPATFKGTVLWTAAICAAIGAMVALDASGQRIAGNEIVLASWTATAGAMGAAAGVALYGVILLMRGLVVVLGWLLRMALTAAVVMVLWYALQHYAAQTT